MAQHGKKPWEDKLLRGGYFVGALLLHLIAFALVAKYAIFPSLGQRPDPTVTTQFIPPTPPPPPKVPVDTTAATSVDATITSAPPPVPFTIPTDLSNHDFQAPTGAPGVEGSEPIGLQAHPKVPEHGMSSERRKLIEKFVTRYRPPGDVMHGDKANPVADFPVYVASYANGNWSCNLNLDADGNIIAGSLPNLVAKIDEWTHGRINGHVAPKPLNIGGPELLATMPPFIFFTGHKDFVLTPQEIDNLRDYIVAGGAIWGDNALAGHGSRFDVAFHREMERVVPSEDAKFEPLTADTDIFKSHFQIGQTPQGINFYSEPIEHLDLDGKLAILYTPDDYSDLFTMRILPGDEQIQGTLPPPGSDLATSGLFLDNREVFFRNFTLPSSLAVHRLGLNIVTYLLTRFDDELLLSP